MGTKVTHGGHYGVRELRLGGTGKGLKGSQPLMPARPTVWYPNNLPAAVVSTVSDGQVTAFLEMLAPLVATLAMIQSVAMGACFRSVQPGVVPGGTFTANGVTSGAAGSFFDSSRSFSESVSVDLVSKNPALAYDVAVRLAAQVANYIDLLLTGSWGSYTPTSIGTGGVLPSQANFTSAVAAIPVNGEPVIALVNPLTLQGLRSAGTLNLSDIQQIFATRLFRALACTVPSTGGTPTLHNSVLLPSALALCSAPLGTSTGTTSNIVSGIAGNIQKKTSTAIDSETGTPQLSLQLVMGNTGTGPQTIYVNGLVQPILINPANAVQVLS